MPPVAIVQHMLYYRDVLAAPPRLDALTRVGRALADPTRCQLLMALLDGPAYPAGLAMTLGLTRANVSNHLACLRGCGLIIGTPQGRHVRYDLADPALAHALRDLADLVPTIQPHDSCPAN